MTDQKPADVTGTAPKDNKSGQDVTEKPAAGPREPKRLWAYRGKISEKEGIRTAISWDGPPSPAYTCFVPESYADELKRECEKYKASYMDCLSSLSSEKDYGGELKRELEYAKAREKRDMQDRIDQAKELMAERNQLRKELERRPHDIAYCEAKYDKLVADLDQLRKERDELLAKGKGNVFVHRHHYDQALAQAAALAGALEDICHPNMRPEGPAQGAIDIARSALAAYREWRKGRE